MQTNQIRTSYTKLRFPPKAEALRFI